MKFAATALVLSVAGVPVLGQSSPASSAASSGTSTASGAASSGASSAASGASSAVVSGSSKTAATALTYSLATVNPTAVSLASITANETSLATIPLPSTASPGATPSISGAPALPDPSSISSSSYPTWDKTPPIDSDEVKQWINDVANSGISIPNITQTVLGGCAANPEALADTSRCWWTCGGCTRDTDVESCPTKLTWGLTYDDGPSFYTPNLLSYLTEADLKATFFVVGSRGVEFPKTLQEEYMSGHQIAVHTWSHPYLTTLSNEEVIAELGWTKKIIKDVTGVTPNMMRPPFGDIDDRVRNISLAMGLTPVMWTRMSATATFDTDDFDVHGGLSSSFGVLNNWENIIGNASTIDTGFIVLEHDLFEESVQLATGYILPSAQKQNFDIKPVVMCLNRPMEDAYIETNDNKTNPPVATGLSSAQATGGSSSGSNGAAGLSVPVGGFSLTLALGVFAVVAMFS